MRNYSFPLAAVLALLIACSSHAAEKPRPAQVNQNQPKKVWTNEDMAQLRARGLISVVGQQSAQQPTNQTPATPATEKFPAYASALDDPYWYASESSELQAELDRRETALHQQLEAIALAKDRITQPGLALDKDNAGVTPAAGVANLQAQVQEVQSMLDELSDLARQHNIDPGVLRG
jgi:hypothetical protein